MIYCKSRTYKAQSQYITHSIYNINLINTSFNKKYSPITADLHSYGLKKYSLEVKI